MYTRELHFDTESSSDLKVIAFYTEPPIYTFYKISIYHLRPCENNGQEISSKQCLTTNSPDL